MTSTVNKQYRGKAKTEKCEQKPINYLQSRSLQFSPEDDYTTVKTELPYSLIVHICRCMKVADVYHHYGD